MLLMECNHIKKYFGERLIIEIDNLKIYTGDKIGIIGVNGAGKTTLIKILNKMIEPDEGSVRLYANTGYISQLDSPRRNVINKEMASKFNVQCNCSEHMSGGEKTRFKIAQAMEDNNLMIMADEPTSNMDMNGIKLLEEVFTAYEGALVLISHDRTLLDSLCEKILEIENGKIKIYQGNYSDYKNQKDLEMQRGKFEYEEYIKEKNRLENAMIEKKQKASSLKKTPKRMGNSEARLHKMGPQKAKANLEGAAKNIEKRIEHMEVKEKITEPAEIKLTVIDSCKIYSKIVIEGSNINKIFGKKIIFKDAEFHIPNGSKTAIIGSNGSGKSTLIKMIINGNDSLKLSPGLKIGYFSQDMDILDENQNILASVMENSIYNENFARLLLAGLLFRGDDVYKRISVLSGGEKVKVSFAKILLQDVNMFILDEPTNYLDIQSLEVIEEVLKGYDGTLIFVTHDRSFINSVADRIMTIDDFKINTFPGNYDEYITLSEKNKDTNHQEVEKRLMVLENQLIKILGKISMPSKNDDVEALDREYNEILKQIRKIKL
ncbi:MAG: ribosomal protection-like ABC-F family protein [Eubacteriales bacterium]